MFDPSHSKPNCIFIQSKSSSHFNAYGLRNYTGQEGWTNNGGDLKQKQPLTTEATGKCITSIILGFFRDLV